MARRTTGRPCRKCRVGVHYGAGYCDKCLPSATTTKWSLHHRGRSTTQRGYGTGWEQIKKTIVMRDKGLCQPCKRLGIATPYTQVDHVIAQANGGSHNANNLQCICTPCHNVKTSQDRQPRR